MKNIIGTLVLMIALAVGTQAQEWKVNVGEKTPAFKIVDRENKNITPESLKGKVVLLNFFATWCPPCREELPRLEKEIWKDLKHEELAVFVLAREEGWEKIDPFIKQHGYTFPVYPDLKRGVFALFAEQSIPRNVVLDRQGQIIYQSIGFEHDEFTKMVQIIKAELGKK